MITLDYFKTHPLRVPKDQRALLIAKVRHAETTSVMSDELHPTLGAYIHYGGVELADMLTITKPNLTEGEIQQLADLWFRSCGKVCKQLLFYTWQIIFKELRHGTNSHTKKAFNGYPIDDDYLNCVKAITSSQGGYMDCVDAIGHRSVGPLVDAVERHFRKGGWGGAYGGAKWADIAVVVQQYFNGETSAMLAADRAWTLVHNTGPIFNKGFYFKYHDGNLQTVLNAQASSSVFTLSDKIEQHSDYQHQCLVDFLAFKKLAVAAINKINPDYKPGDLGAVNSDGSKVTSKPGITLSNTSIEVTKKNVGPFKISAIKNERVPHD